MAALILNHLDNALTWGSAQTLARTHTRAHLKKRRKRREQNERAPSGLDQMDSDVIHCSLKVSAGTLFRKFKCSLYAL